MNSLASLMQGAFPQPGPYSTPGIGDGMPGANPMGGLASVLQQGRNPIRVPMQQLDMPQMPEIKEKRPVWKDILGSVLDTIAVAGGRQAGYWPGIQKDQDEAKAARERLLHAIALQRQKAADRAASLQDWQFKERNKVSNAARMAQEAGYQPGTREFQAAVIQYMQRPIMIGGEAYAPQAPQGGGLPQDYNPDEWEVVE